MRRTLIPMLSMLVLGGYLACTPDGVPSTIAASNGSQAGSGLAYGESPRQKLDVYVPRGVNAPARVVIFVHGGSWQGGRKEDCRFVGEALASEGFVAVVPEYRVYPEIRFPEFVEDCARAVRWVHDNAQRFGGGPDRIYLVGHSAGAHIAALLTLDRHYLKDVGLERQVIRATVGLAGAYDFLPFHEAWVRRVMGPREGWPMTQPIAFADGTAPPMLLAAGEKDNIVKPRNTRRLAARIRECGGEVETIFYPDLDHGRIFLALARGARDTAPVLHDVAAFIRAH